MMDNVQSDGNIFSPCEDEGIEVIGLNIDLENNAENSVGLVELGLDLSSPQTVKTDLIGIKRKGSINCLICGKKFNQNAGRYNHMKKVHNIFRGEKSNIRCLEKDCSFKCSYKEKLQVHLIEEHEIDMDVRIKTFESWSDFMQWKDEFEKQEKSRFVKKSGSRLREEGIRVVYYYCSRSGSYVSQSQGIKKSKRKGSSKSSHHCTASMTCIELADGKIEVKICATHYGHDTELQHLRLTQTDKFQIAEQLIKGISRDVVIDNIRSSVGSDVDRIHLITVKDVKNIEKAYGIQSSSNAMADNMFYNINNWVSHIKQSEHSPVVYFQGEGKCDSISYDVTLILMTVGQFEALKKYGQSGIFYVHTYVTSNKHYVFNQNNKPTSDIYITTLVVVDDSNEAVPVSFMISNKSDVNRFKIFFQCMKEKVPETRAKAVLTDDHNDIFEAWCSVFVENTDEKPYHLWSNRFVDKDWRDNLICIPNEEVQESIYEKLYSYLESPDPSKVETTLKPYVDNELLTNDMTSQFGTHFTCKYLGSESLWAGCYGKRIVAIHAQLNMECLSNEIEEVIDRKHFDRKFIVRTVQDLLKLVSDKQCYRQAKFQRQVQELPNHHNRALKIKVEAILRESEDRWRVNSLKDPENIYSVVTKKSDKCGAEECPLLCSKCGACAHEFQCSCSFYSYDKTLCKHIHAVAMNFFPKEPDSTCSEDIPQSLEKELLLLKREGLWGRYKRKRKLTPQNESNEDPSTTTGEENLLQAIEEVLHNKKVKNTKRSRGRPRKKTNENIENSNTCKDLNRPKESYDEEQQSENSSFRSRVNILRKSKKTLN